MGIYFYVFSANNVFLDVYSRFVINGVFHVKVIRDINDGMTYLTIQLNAHVDCNEEILWKRIFLASQTLCKNTLFVTFTFFYLFFI